MSDRLREALEREAQSSRTQNAEPDIVVRAGEPVRQIFDQTSSISYDLVVVGARWTGATGQYWRSERTYEVIKAIQPPVLVAIGERKQLKRFLVCTGGKEFIEQAVRIHRQDCGRCGSIRNSSARHGRTACHLRQSGTVGGER